MSGTPAARLREAIERIRAETSGRRRLGVDHDAADAVVGTIATDDAIGFDPMPLLAALHQAGAEATAIGQIAGILHGSTELTGDLDLLWSGAPEQAASLATAFAAVGAELTDDDGRPVATDRNAFALPKVMFRTESASGDCCTPRLPWGALDVAAFVERAETCEIDGVTVRYLRLDDLQAMRRAVGRPKDLRRVVELDRVRPATADRRRRQRRRRQRRRRRTRWPRGAVSPRRRAPAGGADDGPARRTRSPRAPRVPP